VGAVIGGRLYLVLLDGARSHYFAAALPDFEAVANSARLRRYPSLRVQQSNLAVAAGRLLRRCAPRNDGIN
jgi:hypothetical protein